MFTRCYVCYYFSEEWSSVLESDVRLTDQERNSFKITIRWFLGFCQRAGVGADFDQARAFIEFAQVEKGANDWVVERWREAIRWFFRNGKAQAAPSAEYQGVKDPHSGCMKVGRGEGGKGGS